MTTGCTIVTPLMPDPAAILQAVADIDPDLRVYANPDDLCWEILHPRRDAVLVVIDPSSWVRVPGEVERIIGSDMGLPPEVLNSPDGLHWLDVHRDEDSEEAQALMFTFAATMAERGRGSYVEHHPDFTSWPAASISEGMA